MKRNIISDLMIWKNSGTKVPLLVYGPRGTGKTYTILEFVQNEFPRYIYINIESSFKTKEFFEEKIVSERTIDELILELFGISIELSNEIVFVFDEIEACPAFCKLMRKYEKEHKLNIICSASFIPLTYLDMFYPIRLLPFTFDEYLSGIGKEWYKEVIEGHYTKQKPVPGLIHEELLELYYDYLRTGGMPSVINEFISSNETINIEEKQRLTYISVLNDIALYGNADHYKDISCGLIEGDAKKMQDIINASVIHVGLDRQKFTFNLIRRGLTNKMYTNAIKLLESNGYIYSSKKIEEEGFRITLFDVGIINYKLRTEFDLAEEEINNRLVWNNIIYNLSVRCKVFFWDSKYTAHVDCIFEDGDKKIPLEVNINARRKGKSIKMYSEKYIPAYIVFVNNDNYKIGENTVNMPVYSTFMLAK